MVSKKRSRINKKSVGKRTSQNSSRIYHSHNKTQLQLSPITHSHGSDDTAEKKHLPIVLRNVYHEYKFNLADGSSLNNLYELALALQDMAPQVFNHHVNQSRNDFARWVRDVMQQHDLADQLECVSTKQETETAVLRYLLNNLAQGPVAHDYMNVNNFFNLTKI